MLEKYEKGLLSIIVPCYNVEKYLKRCIDSIISNSYQHIEIICINDGSTDLTLKVLQSINDPRMKIINQSNKGISAARNAGLLAAKGEYICFIDSDDWIDSIYFEILIKALRANNAMVVMCEHYRTDTYCLLDDHVSQNHKERVVSVIELLDNNQYKQFVWAKLYRREFINGMFFNENLHVGEDKIFNMLSSIKKPTALCVNINYKGYYYYNSATSTFRTLTSEKILPLLSCLDIMLEKNLPHNEFLALELFKSSLASRYLLMFQPDRDEVKYLCNQYIDKSLKHLKKNLTFGSWIKFLFFARFSFIYRLFRLITDSSMLQWERNQRKAMKKHKTRKNTFIL